VYLKRDSSGKEECNRSVAATRPVQYWGRKLTREVVTLTLCVKNYHGLLANGGAKTAASKEGWERTVKTPYEDITQRGKRCEHLNGEPAGETRGKEGQNGKRIRDKQKKREEQRKDGEKNGFLGTPGHEGGSKKGILANTRFTGGDWKV